MAARRASGVVGAAVVAIGVIVGTLFLNPEIRLDARSDWRSFAEGFRRSSAYPALSGTGRVRMRFAGLNDADTIALSLAALPGRDPLVLEVARGGRPPVRFSVGATPTTIHVGSGRGSQIRIEVDGADASMRAFYDLREIKVTRAAPARRALPWIPAVAGLGLYAAARRRRSIAASALWALTGVAIAAAFTADPLVAYVAADRVGQTWGAAALLAALAILVEPQLRGLPKATVCGGLALFVAVQAHVPGLNGPSHWQWGWQRRDALVLFPALLAAFLPLFIARAVHRRRSARIGFVLALAAAGVALSQTAAMMVQPGGLARLPAIVEDPTVTSYFTDARQVAFEPGWLGSHPARLGSLNLHSRTKPAGPVLFYVILIRLFGPGAVSAALGGLLIGLAAALSVPAVYGLARQFNETADAAFEASCVMALAPSLLLFFPEFDQAFPLVTCLLLILWRRALNGRGPSVFLFGVCAFLATFFSYSFLVLGVAFVAMGLGDLRSAMRAAFLSSLVMVASYAALYALSGFDPIANFQAAVSNQTLLAARWDRDYLPALITDPLDFALGAGWLASFLAMVTLTRMWRERTRDLPSAMGALQVATVNLSGLLRAEAARVWLLLTPFVAIPAGRELARWTPVERTATYVMMALLAAALSQNMVFIDLRPPQ